jgi:segregation and condensation protein B
MNELVTQIEALLFALGKPLSRADLIKMLEVSTEEIESAIGHLLEAAKSDDRGVVLVDDGREVELRSAPMAAELVAKIRREELSRDLGRAGAEVLAVLIYKGPSTRSTIDFIRGVNSAAALRTLTMRGLVRRSTDEGARTAIYDLTTESLGYLGIENSAQAPEYASIRERLQKLDSANNL